MASAFYYQPTTQHAFAERIPPYYPSSSPAPVRTSMKRKHSSEPSSDNESSRSPSPVPLHKRRRCATIERGFDNLRLDPPPPPAPVVEEPDDVASGHPYSYYPDAEEIQQMQMQTPPTREVHMHNSSWYEPEKDRTYTACHAVEGSAHMDGSGIVITDLDASDSEAEGDDDQDGRLKFSKSLLNALKRSAIPSSLLPSDPSSSALVLFRPSPWNTVLPPPSIEVLDDAVPEPMVDDLPAEPMDLDPMDIEL